MQYTFTYPPLPSLARLRDIYRDHPGVSCLRALEYEQLRAVPLAGRVLDVGGGDKARYRSQLPANIDYGSVNIDPAIAPTYTVAPGEPFPIGDDVYDCCLCMNTLEHVYDARFVLSEIRRVLKPGGTAYITVPFIFRVHGHPDDYFRGTTSWWRETLSREGFDAAEICPLVWGRATTADSIKGTSGLFPGLRSRLAHLSDIAYARATSRSGNGRYEGKRGDRISAVALGYFITARK